MWLLMLEAGVAMFLLVFIVWWTMFSGPKPEHRRHETPAAPENAAATDTKPEDESAK